MKITCPQCGAEIAIQPRSLQLICTFCNTPLIFDKEPFLESYVIEPTLEEGPAISLAKVFLAEKNRFEEILKKDLLYLPFYRFLYERRGKMVEKVLSASKSTPFPLFTIPSGSMVQIKKNDKELLVEPEKKLSVVLENLKKEKTKSLEEMLLLYLPFWKVTISSGETIWIDAVQGKVLTHTIFKIQKRTEKLLKSIFTGFFILLLVEGIIVPSYTLRFLLQGATAVGFFYFIKSKFYNEN